MKILIVRTFPDILNLNSYNVQEIGLAKALTLKGHQCDIVLYNGKHADRRDPYLFEHDGKKYRFTIYWLKGVFFLKNGFMPSVKKIISDYDVIQVHEYDQIMSWELYTRPQKPTVIYHGPYYGEYAKGYNLKCRIFDHLFLQRRNYKDVVALTKSKLATEFLVDKGFRHVITVGVGINTDNFEDCGLVKKHEIESEGDFAPKEVVCGNKNLLYVGKIEERRNVYFLIEVFRKLHKEDPAFKLTLIGSGDKEYKERFLKFIEPELTQRNIIYKEKATQKELAEYYKQADLFIFTSNYEIFGMVLLEAMYFGVPVISSVNGGSTTLIHNGYNGYILERFDEKKWVECILSVMKDKEEWKSLSMHAKETIRLHYTWDALADKFLDAYELAIKEFEG